MIKCKTLAILFLLVTIFINCNKRTMPPESNKLERPSGLKLLSGYRSLIVSWTPSQKADIAGYYIYYGKASRIYSDTVFVASPVTWTEISGLESDQQYYCTIAAIDQNDNLSELAPEQSAFTYLAFEDFSGRETLDKSSWHFDIDYDVPIEENMVSAAEVHVNGERIMRSFGQYLKYRPEDHFFIECQFKLGTPNVGGAGIMLRSQMATPDKFYKGYYAYIFWNTNKWQLHLEESLLDRYAIHNLQPVKLPSISPNEWLKLSVQYDAGKITARVIRLSDFSVLGTLSVKEHSWSRRPTETDVYCGFFTTQYGGNIIYTDNFGIGRLK